MVIAANSTLLIIATLTLSNGTGSGGTNQLPTNSHDNIPACADPEI
jgi:hypothetical protein